MRLQEFDEKERLEKANEKLTKYKTAAGADATAADAAGNLARGNTRFKGINRATKKQFANDAKLAKLKEFAPSDDGDGPDSDEVLRRIAAHWWNGTEQQMIRAEQTLAAMGWEIGEDEGYDDGGVFVVRAGDEHGRSYISWPHEELELNEVAPPVEQGVAEGLTEMDKSQPSAGRDTGPREGPEKIAKPITKEKMVKHALDTLSKSMSKKDDKKKDVAEDSLAAMQRLAGIAPQISPVVPNGQRQYRHMPTAVQPR